MYAPAGALLTDLYQLTMLQGYRHAGLRGEAVFELFCRRLPPCRNFLLVAGLEQLLDYLETLRFDDDELDWLARCGRFDDHFVDYLRGLRFHGTVHAVAEGTVLFAGEPLLRVHARIDEAQLVESRLINLVHYPTLVASKAARCVLAAPGRQLVDFGMRRAHGGEAALLAARAAWIAGFAGTATVEAGRRFDIPLFGTMAHSYVEAHVGEAEAFRSFAAAQPGHCVLLVDTYDSACGARRVVPLAEELARDGVTVRAVRIDSGNLAEESRRVRRILDEAGMQATGIFVSGDLDEHRLARLLADGAPIDGFGVGSRLTTSHDRPYLDFAYKLQAYAGRPCRKRSPGKATWPGAKQVWRGEDAEGSWCGDRVTLADEPGRAGEEPLLRPVMVHGRRVEPSPPLESVRQRASGQLAALPDALRGLQQAPRYRVHLSSRLRALARTADALRVDGGAGSGRAEHHAHEVGE